MSPLYNNFKDILLTTWPIVFVSLVVLISFRLSYVYKNKVKIVLHNEILLLIFAFYVLILFQIVTLSDQSVSSSSNFIPFKEIMRYKLFSNLFVKNVIGNVLLFLPYGFFVGKFFSVKSKFLTFFLLLLASVSIEGTQLLIGRVFDVDDILLNVIGGIIGYIIYRLLDKTYDNLPKILKSSIFLNILSIILLLIIIISIVLLLI